MIHFLLEHGADPGLAEEQPLLLTAARCCGPEVVALFAGQAAKLSPKQKERAFQEVRWGKRPENIPVLEKAGISVSKFGGEAFRAAVSDGQAELAKLLLEKGADRNAMLLAVGGGILTDMAGFAAAIYKRGIRVSYVPTTLLAQVDASVGGKTGVNFYGYKNMLGVIRQPDFTYICREVLETLPYEHILEGAAEMIKTFIIKDNGNYRKAVGLFSGMRSGHMDLQSGPEARVLSELVREAVAVKAEIVSEDQFESGARRKLNLGHTFAHAIEWCDHGISHGQAVSIGMVCAARLSEAEGICSKGLAVRIRSDLEACGLRTDMPFPASVLADAMDKDKKAENGKINFVLIKEIGTVQIVPLTSGSVVESFERI